MRRAIWLTAGLLGATAVAAAPASGSVTIGSNLATTPNISPNIVGTQTTVQKTLDPTHTAADGLTAPFSGVVVLFRYRQDSASVAPVTFRVIHPVAGLDTSTGAGTSQSIVPGVGLNPTPVRMPIMAGDSIGIDCCSGAAHSGFYKGPGPPNEVGTYIGWNAPALADGGMPRLYNNSDSTLEILLNATIEPDADHDGFGDETQDQCVGVAGANNGCPPASTPLGSPGTPPARTPSAKKCKQKKHHRQAGAAKKKCKRKK
jgi:hypothetical protein